MVIYARSRFELSLPCIALLTLAGCAGGTSADPELTSVIRAHYAANATEESGQCRSPKIDTIQEHRLLERSEEGSEVMMVRYSYFDRYADMDADWDKLVYLSQPCGGIAERLFVVDRSASGYRVVSMDGERHGAEGDR